MEQKQLKSRRGEQKSKPGRDPALWDIFQQIDADNSGVVSVPQIYILLTSIYIHYLSLILGVDSCVGADLCEYYTY